jgi:hypothetical protein
MFWPKMNQENKKKGVELGNFSQISIKATTYGNAKSPNLIITISIRPFGTVYGKEESDRTGHCGSLL